MQTIWLPGNKDLRNQGLIYSEPTGSYYIANDSVRGKVIHTTSGGNINTMIKSVDGWDLSTTSCGFGAWLKFNLNEMRYGSAYTYTSTYTVLHNVVLGFNSYGGFSLDLTSNNIYSSGAFTSASLAPNIRFGNTMRSTTAKPIVFDEWHHHYIQYNKTKNRLEYYYDGVLFASGGTENVAISAFTQNFTINNATVWGGNPPGKYLPYYVSDVRVYNIELTPEEIKEISKQKLFEINGDSHFKGSTNLLSYSNLQGHGSSFALITDKFEGMSVYRNIVTSPNTGNNAGFSIRSSITPSGLASATKITLSFYKKLNTVYGKNLGGYIRVVKQDSSDATYSWSYNKANWANDAQSIGKWEYITATVTIPTGCTSIKHVYVYTDNATGGNCDFSKIQLELNSEPTPYTVGTRPEILFDANGTNGIQHPQSVVKSGSTFYFDGSNSLIQTSELDFMKIVDSNFTISFWINSQDATSSRSVYFGCGNQGNGWTISLEKNASSNTFRIWNNQAPDWSINGFVVEPNVWTHVVVSRSGNTVTVYKNGTSVGTNTNFSNHASYDKIYYLGGDYRTGDTRYKGYIGDFKIYAGPFSATEVTTLYNKEKIKYQ